MGTNRQSQSFRNKPAWSKWFPASHFSAQRIEFVGTGTCPAAHRRSFSNIIRSWNRWVAEETLVVCLWYHINKVWIFYCGWCSTWFGWWLVCSFLGDRVENLRWNEKNIISNRECFTPEHMTQLGGWRISLDGLLRDVVWRKFWFNNHRSIDRLGWKMVFQKNPCPVWSVESTLFFHSSIAPIEVTFQVRPFSTEPWLCEDILLYQLATRNHQSLCSNYDEFHFQN